MHSNLFTETTCPEDLPDKTEIPGTNGIREKTRLSIKPGIVVTSTNTECELSSCVREMAATGQHRRACSKGWRGVLVTPAEAELVIQYWAADPTSESLVRSGEVG